MSSIVDGEGLEIRDEEHGYRVYQHHEYRGEGHVQHREHGKVLGAPTDRELGRLRVSDGQTSGCLAHKCAYHESQLGGISHLREGASHSENRARHHDHAHVRGDP